MNTCSSKNQSADSAARGATLLEFSLVANLIFLLFSAIVDFSLVVTRYNIVSQAIQSAARAVQVERANCETVATDVFRDAVLRFGLPVDVTDFTAVVAGGEVTLTVEAQIPCYVCRVIFMRDVSYQQSAVVPLEEAGGCPDTP